MPSTLRHLDPKRLAERAPIPTWFGVGGPADRLARPESLDELRTCLRMDHNLRVLGDGANLLVDDAGVAELVVCLDRPAFASIQMDERSGRVVAGAGAKLPRLLNETTRAGLGGLESLGGIPATVGGAAVMNAGGAFGEIGPAIARVHGLDRSGNVVAMSPEQCAFGYRASALHGLVITAVEFQLTPADPVGLRARLHEVMEYKKNSQPLKEDSAGCCFKNPTLACAIDGIGDAGRRVSAGMLIDRAGCKGLEVGGATVSRHHANFIVTRAGARARDIIELMAVVQQRVLDAFGVHLEPEVVVWKRSCPIEEMAR
ncbi:MAG: UDP-N-acetylmuramate dehydrogenase [Phycisphaerales bacterium]